MFPSWSWIFGLLFGATIGSFLNVVIYRLPRGLSLSNPKNSFCPNCKHQLGVPDLFPLLSYVFSGGKCRYCKVEVASRYFWVETLNGVLWSLIFYQYLILQYEPLKAAFYCFMCAALVAVIFIDWELYIIPDELNATLLVIGVAYQVWNKTPMVALTGALTGWGVLWGIAFFGRLAFRKDAMGHGDIKMMRGVGALIGPAMMVPNMAIAVVSGLVVGVAGIVLSKKSAAQSSLSVNGEAASDTVDSQDEDYAPESIGSLLIHGVWYLLCLDIVAIFLPKMYKWIGEEQLEQNVDDDDWVPSMTTIPFGPYLAIGAILCMVFASPIEKGISMYLQNFAPPKSGLAWHEVRFAVSESKRINWSAASVLGCEQDACLELPSETRSHERGGNDWN